MLGHWESKLTRNNLKVSFFKFFAYVGVQTVFIGSANPVVAEVIIDQLSDYVFPLKCLLLVS